MWLSIDHDMKAGQQTRQRKDAQTHTLILILRTDCYFISLLKRYSAQEQSAKILQNL